VYGLRVGVLRFFTVFGPGQRPDLAIGKFMRLIARGEPVPMYGDGASSRDYTYVDDVVAGTLAACDVIAAAAAGYRRVWNLGNNEPVALADMIRRIGQVVGREPVIDRLPMQPGDVRRTWADLSRSSIELGYRPQVDFDEGLRRQWAWMQASSAAPAPDQ
jgi:UDP-glucuronate 4-epimerase